MRFKLSTKSRVLLGAGTFLIVMMSLVLAQLQQTQMLSRAEQEMAQTELILGKLASVDLVSRQEGLAERLNLVKAELAAAKNSLEQSLETIESSGDIYDIARQSEVTITRIDSSAPEDEEISGVRGSVLKVKVKAQGTVADLIDFIYGLTEKYGTAQVTSALISVPEAAGATEGSGDGGSVEEEEPRAVVTLLIYDYRGD